MARTEIDNLKNKQQNSTVPSAEIIAEETELKL